MKRFALILVVAVAFVAASCSSPAPGGPPPPTPSGCLPAKGSGNPPQPADIYYRWNGVVGDDVNLTLYTDATCQTIVVDPNYFYPSGFATVLSPAPPVPPPYTSWVDVPLLLGTTSQSSGTAAHTVALGACSTLFGDVGTATVSAGYMLDAVIVADSLPANLWACIAIDWTTNPPTQVRP
ncbi:MAG TPA: hypothetical protein VJM33_11920 [Microthrixaceae bacterium]|nr:hypothetical protein [Microthrixaceae bacterium]